MENFIKVIILVLVGFHLIEEGGLAVRTKIGKTITKITYEYSDGSEETVDFTKVAYPLKPIKENCLSNKCQKCGLDLSNAMGYCCNKSDCPVYPQVTC
jgi:hypothetical protein